MKLASKLLIILSMVSTTAMADATQCKINKYNQYIDTSLQWYNDLISLSTQNYPELSEVGQWFLNGRIHHFELNRQAVNWYLLHDPNKLNLTQPVESWLNLTQQDIKVLAQQDSELSKQAKLAFNDRQAKPHPQNYALRSAFAELLTQPKKINVPLTLYNKNIAKIGDIQCD